ncbi:ABC-type transport system ATP-binding protein [Halalkaliarchaeum desulfuricum]|uniref:ABC-type transport system ATP-binding protein n=1 Tax=Halalkaliarchaeum desulfuricum TaxID=2055893 RepID=A0A343TNJ9_9EURY|nr:ABC transporter ATP-binding protein [Halalkaliarchaeum desulfuricum]AUX10671.1 ABC-type transport system ATP-binding protein [Halalkaliarchaeum desulfuricum]
MAAIELSGVRKEFADVTAVRDLDLTVEEGEVYGFLGPNGAGKSTTINILLDFVRPTAGEARVLGRDAHRESLAVRQRTGVLPEGFGVYDRLSGRQHVEFAIDSKDADDDPDELLARVGLAADSARKAGGYSKGMRQRLALAMALVGEPELLILDEPSSGLDPTGAKDMREIVREEVDRGATVFFSSHVLGQVEAVCDRVGILRDGRLVAEDSVEGLREAVGDDETLVITVGEGSDGLAAVTDTIRDLDGVSAVELDGDTLTVSCRGDAKTAVLSTLEAQGVPVDDFTTREASLEDLFLAYTEGDAVDSGGSSTAAEAQPEQGGST